MTRILIENMDWLHCHDLDTDKKIKEFLIESSITFLYQDIMSFDFIKDLNQFLYQKNLISKNGDVFLCSPQDYYLLWGSKKTNDMRIKLGLETDRPSPGNRK